MAYNLVNYENINNILNLRLKNINKEINTLIENLKNKSKNLLEMDKNKQNEMIIIYKINSNRLNLKLNIFGENFVKNNKNNCYILINNKRYELSKFYLLNEKEKNENKILIIKLIEFKKIYN